MFFITSCKTSYIVEYIETDVNSTFEKKIDGTPNFFIIIDKSLVNNNISVETGSLSGTNVIYNETFQLKRKNEFYKVIKAKNTENILITINKKYFPIEINKYQRYRFLFIKKMKRCIYLTYSNELPDTLNQLSEEF
ncbi:hypothetical protein SY27_00480 [Flavobacterium sp. 316]|uniref:hypothetical protein n=1 Tax=Flavobacterium sp. 316 TaxID=1603293 RepID=UPI0005DE6C4C|nr:hypothetical protein [Flavobacterium sp. 316]KIX22371.1 hypothetical protein SY27_00480 [Flavobacterium sp. 316]